MLHHFGAGGVTRSLALNLLVDAPFLQQVFEVDAGGRRIEGDGFGFEHGFFDVIGRRNRRHRRTRADDDAGTDAADVETARIDLAVLGKSCGSCRRGDDHIKSVAGTDALLHLWRGVERDLDLVTGGFLEGMNRSMHAGFDGAAADQREFSRVYCSRQQQACQCRNHSFHRIAPSVVSGNPGFGKNLFRFG